MVAKCHCSTGCSYFNLTYRHGLCCIKRIKAEFCSSLTNLPQISDKNRWRGRWLCDGDQQHTTSCCNMVFGFQSLVPDAFWHWMHWKLPSAQMDISAVKGPFLWLQLFYTATQKFNYRKSSQIIFDLTSYNSSSIKVKKLCST